jgi:cytochrome c553
MLLTLVGAIALIGLLTILMRGTSREEAVGAVGLTAFGPADFKHEIDWEKALHPELPTSGNGSGESQFQVPPPPFSEDVYPCSDCHGEDLMETNPVPRRLTVAHEEILIDHGPTDRWCFDCHNTDKRDWLRLVDGKLVRFEESYRLCGQCHGTIYRDWRFGIHGRRSGYWNGPKVYLLCAHCHDPHAPRFSSLKPLPPPVRPALLGE